MSTAIEESESKLIADRAAQPVIDSFLRYQRLAEAGGAGTIAEASILPVDSLPDAAELPDGCPADLLDATVMIKLNGGLGTGMGMTRAKSLIEAKDGLSFLDIIARQVLDVRERTGARMPLMLMNSFATQADTLAALRKYPSLAVEGLGIDFLQNRVPKLRADNLRPVDWPADRELEWAPPGHGDLYTSLLASGSLDALRKQGFRYAFVSNADNLGAVLDDRILNWFASEGIPFLIEAADRTEADRKGGHLARTPDGRLLLREIAQTADADLEAFQDIARHRFFNTNSIWLDLDALAAALELGGGVLDLPMIINQKTVDPADPESTAVIQIESAMGAAIALFDGADAIRVPRSRFAPVKATNDLLAVRSDAYELTAEGHVVLSRQREGRPPIVELDSRYFKLLSDFEARFPQGPPSLIGCDSLSVEGDVTFGANVTVRGSVRVIASSAEPMSVASDSLLAG